MTSSCQTTIYRRMTASSIPIACRPATTADNPLLRGLDRPVRRAAVRAHQARAFPAGLRARLRRARRRDRRDRRRSGRRRRFANTIEALERAGRALDRVGDVFGTSPAPTPTTRCRRSSARSRRARARHWNGILLNERAVPPHRRALTQRATRSASTPSRRACSSATTSMFMRAGAALDADGEEAARRDHRAAGDARHHVQPERARRRAGLHAGARERGRSRRPARFRARRPRAQAAAERGLAGKHVITLSRSQRRAVPAILGAPRPAREGLPRLDRARRQRRRDRQQGDHRRDGGAARRARAAARLRELRALPARRHDGEDARRRCAACSTAVWTPARARALADRDAMQALIAGGGRQFQARALGLALLRREAAQGRVRPRRGDDQALSPARPHHRGGVLHRQQAVRPVASSAAHGRAGLSSRRAGLGGARRRRPPSRPVLRRLFRARLQAQRRLDDHAPRPGEAHRRHPADRRQRDEFLQGRRRRSRRCFSFDDARTLFHEFGHALHGLLSDVTYPMISGTSVLTDFVELPSQLYEHWLEQPEILRRFAVHYRTGEPMPEDAARRGCSRRAPSTRALRRSNTSPRALVDLDLHLLADARGLRRRRLRADGARRASACRRRSSCATARRISRTSSPATAMPPPITAICGRRCSTPTRSRPSRRPATSSIPATAKSAARLRLCGRRLARPGGGLHGLPRPAADAGRAAQEARAGRGGAGLIALRSTVDASHDRRIAVIPAE